MDLATLMIFTVWAAFALGAAFALAWSFATGQWSGLENGASIILDIDNEEE